jgi:hypothetical protein
MEIEQSRFAGCGGCLDALGRGAGVGALLVLFVILVGR